MRFTCSACAYYGEGDWSQCKVCSLKEDEADASDRAALLAKTVDELRNVLGRIVAPNADLERQRSEVLARAGEVMRRTLNP